MLRASTNTKEDVGQCYMVKDMVVVHIGGDKKVVHMRYESKHVGSPEDMIVVYRSHEVEDRKDMMVIYMMETYKKDTVDVSNGIVVIYMNDIVVIMEDMTKVIRYIINT